MKSAKLVLYFFLFLALTVIGVYWAVQHYQISQAFLLLSQLPTINFEFLALLYLLLYITDIWRYQVLGAALRQRIGFAAALEASVANDFFSWITPGAALGAPAAIYVLGKKGLPWDVASIICFAKSMLGSAVLLLLAMLLMLLSLSPQYSLELWALLLWGFGIVLIIIVVPVIAAIKVNATNAWLDRVALKLTDNTLLNAKLCSILGRLLQVFRDAVVRLSKLESGGVAQLLGVILIHIPYLLVFAGMLLLCLIDFSAPLSVQSVAGSIVYVAFTYVAPTPGASGLSEASAAAFFKPLLSPQNAILAVMLFRASTIYLHILVGFVYVSFRGGITVILRSGSKTR